MNDRSLCPFCGSARQWSAGFECGTEQHPDDDDETYRSPECYEREMTLLRLALIERDEEIGRLKLTVQRMGQLCDIATDRR